MTASLFDREACEICGPLPPPSVHAICHPMEVSRNGCGHPLADHTNGLRCRVCGRECGIDCTRSER